MKNLGMIAGGFLAGSHQNQAGTAQKGPADFESARPALVNDFSL